MMADIERVYNIPLRREFLKSVRYKRAKKAVSAVRKFLSKHMKSDKVIIDNSVNLKIWERGIKNPPHHIRVTAKKDKDGVVRAELFGVVKKRVSEEKAKKVKKIEAKNKKSEELQSAQKSQTSLEQKTEGASQDKSKPQSDATGKETKSESAKPEKSDKKDESEAKATKS